MRKRISISGASFSYNDKLVFENLDLNFPTDRITFLTGASGIGKTTLLKIIAGKLKLNKGQLDCPIQKFSYCYQDIRLLPYLTAAGNILYVMPKRNETAKNKKIALDLLEQVGLERCENSYPHELSGGMQRRLMFARALAVDCEFLLLDEIFESLDGDTSKNIMNLLIKQVQEKKIGALCVTHKIPFEHDLTTVITMT